MISFLLGMAIGCLAGFCGWRKFWAKIKAAAKAVWADIHGHG